MRALRRFTVRARLPEPLAPLAELVTNLRWSWHAETRDLFESVDPDLWRAGGGDPMRLLGSVDAARLDALAGDRRFLRRLTDAADELAEYLSAPRWYQSLTDAPAAIAYFSMEYGITEVLPQYSGGLGILAGDHLKSASDLGVPVVGVGLLYRGGYFVQSLSREGWQQERYPGLDPRGLPLTLVTGPDGAPARVSLQLPGHRTLHAQMWRAQVGRVPLLLLDSDIQANADAERHVCDRLYGGGAEHRLVQELLLGVGGVRALRLWSRLTSAPAPEVFHCNEGHAGFLGVERMRELMEQGLTPDEAVEEVRAGTVFTTHTPVPAGIDRFPRELVARHFGEDGVTPAVPLSTVLALGAEGDPETFNMAHMGLRLAQRANGVSKLHGAVSREMFAGLWRGFDPADVPIGSITNGVHAPTWATREVVEAAARENPGGLPDEVGWLSFEKVPDDTLWGVRNALRAELVEEARRRVYASWRQRGASEAELDWVGGVFDPEVLTIGFARRVPSYKRLTLMLREPDRLRALLLDPERPIQIVIAGKSHPADDSGKALVQQMVQFTDAPDVRHRIVFLPDYDMRMAKYLVAGCDVWLNNPLRPLEASGTSGMKAALNGCLNLSIRDGWWDEMYDGENGWAIPSAEVDDPDRRDDLEAAALYTLLEGPVRSRFYDRDRRGGLPVRWIAMVRHTLTELGPQVLASRMVRDYVLRLYTPAAVASRRMSADSHQGARTLSQWRQRVTTAWPGVRVAHVDSAGAGDTPEVGSSLAVRAIVELAGLAPDEVDVQVAYGPVDERDELCSPSTVSLQPAGPVHGQSHRFEGTVPLSATGPFGYTVRVLPHHPLTATDSDLSLVANA